MAKQPKGKKPAKKMTAAKRRSLAGRKGGLASGRARRAKKQATTTTG